MRADCTDHARSRRARSHEWLSGALEEPVGFDKRSLPGESSIIHSFLAGTRSLKKVCTLSGYCEVICLSTLMQIRSVERAL